MKRIPRHILSLILVILIFNPVSGFSEEAGNPASSAKKQVAQPPTVANKQKEAAPVPPISKQPTGNSSVPIPAGKPGKDNPSQTHGKVLTELYTGKTLSYSQVADVVARSSNINPVVLPEVSVAVHMSSSDVNRIVCTGGDVKDVNYSSEKGLDIKVTGKDVWAKFKIMKTDGRTVFASLPVELFITCNNSVYNIIAVPQRVPSQTIRLSGSSSEKIKKNVSVYGSMPLEKKVLALIRAVHTGEIPESFSVSVKNVPVNIYKDINLTLEKIVTMEGEGIRLKSYKVSLNPKSGLLKANLDEKEFLITALTRNTISVAFDKPLLEGKNSVSHLYICERTVD